ncbi:MAG: thioredoxin family protein [Flavobacteriaceae bacterium]|nr:thioredoxin family protein [Flavobacteriaceae bacterium]
MKKLFLKMAFIGLLAPMSLVAQNVKTSVHQEKSSLPKPYNEEEDAFVKINKLVKKAKKENKNIILQVGGNWCIWCLRFAHFVKTTPELKEIVDKNFIYYHLNFSQKYKNEKVFAKYGDDGKELGYPYFIVLDKNGKKIHTQQGGSLEQGKSYSFSKVKSFFEQWIAKK